ncbi:MAG TPA: 30S ribosomal protein S4 [Candidatus Aminicenantes bacterium]|nr:30S ribosomal protein S4 [Acidobacteriota bacterium]HOU48882.1 30S ribosomal protein S4 [Candidatus Aminicenantes bacterium]MDW3226787.1 30S ribosomal protein S4 [Acidobacteriota bacterium]HPN15560.1 30S ribosomal protein S4 [Candidatus Aminicenantes bacterium]HQF97322.1 30S ribosomal protein S4 [Candidatus Aminicenantes bacterium]
MSRYREPLCRLCRVEKTKLFLKGHKCLTDKCPVERRAYAPGQHGRSRRRILGYGLQLREKQKMKRFYGMSEKQFRLFFERAERTKGITGEILLQMLERRLDNLLYIAGYAHSRAHARQLVTHGHVLVNSGRVAIPSFMVKANDEIGFRPQSVKSEDLKAVAEAYAGKTAPGWIQVNRENLTARVMALPTRADVTLPVEEHMVVELYSK